jgi:hypothetical protein
LLKTEFNIKQTKTLFKEVNANVQFRTIAGKVGTLLNYDGLDPIKDSHRRAVTAVLLENQEKFLREQMLSHLQVHS